MWEKTRPLTACTYHHICTKVSPLLSLTKNVLTVKSDDNEETLISVFILFTVKSHFKALGLYNFIRGFGWAYKRGVLYPGGLISGIKRMFRNDEIKRI